MKVETRSGGRDKPADVFKEAANPPTGGNYGKTQADILVRLKKERSSVVTDLDHLPDAAPDLRSKIDADVAKMADPNAGSDGLRAQDRLIKVGRPAIPRVLAATKGLDFSKYPSAREGALDCQLAAAVDHVLREITGYTAPPRLQYTPDSNLGDYTRCIDEWYVWWLTNGYRRETFYRKAEEAEEEKL
jgi:hypothetical protein